MELSAMGSDRRIILAIRIIALIVFPFLLGFWVFPHNQFVRGSLQSSPNENASVSDVRSYSFSSASHSAAIAQSIGSAFPLAEYLDAPPLVSHNRLQLCFQDNGSTITLPNGTSLAPDLTWQVHVNNQSAITLAPGMFACTDISSTEPAYYVWTANVNTGLAPSAVNGTITFNPATLTYPRQVMEYGLLQGLVMIPLFYLVVWYPLIGIWKKLHDGMMAQ